MKPEGKGPEEIMRSNVPVFVAYKSGNPIASAETLGGLLSKEEVQTLLGHESLLIAHVVPEDKIVIYQNPV